MIESNAKEMRDAGRTAPLFHQYPQQCQAQDAYIQLDPEDGTLHADWSGEIGNGVPSDVWHGLSRRYYIAPSLKGEAIADLLEDSDLLGLVARICAGYEETWDGSNNVGTLTDDAQDAEDDLKRLLDAASCNSSNLSVIWTARDWFFNLASVSGTAEEIIGFLDAEDRDQAETIAAEWVDDQIGLAIAGGHADDIEDAEDAVGDLMEAWDDAKDGE